MDLKRIYNLSTQLQHISSTKEKEEFLKENDNEDFKGFLKWLLDPQVVTGIDRKRLLKKVSVCNDCERLTFYGMLQYISSHHTGSDEAVGICQQFIEDHFEYKDFLMDVFAKRLKLGVSTKIVNKAYGKGFIHVHEVQLGSPRDKLRLKQDEWFSLSQKMNGVRCTYVDGKMISRQGKEIKGLFHITSFIDEQIGKNVVLDGELIRKNIDGIDDNENFRLTTGLVNGEGGDKSQLEFVLFDAMSIDELYAGKSKLLYKQRRKIVDSVCAACHNGSVRAVEIVYRGKDQSEIDKQLAIADAKGWEGLMLNKNAPYECKRTTNLIKIKSFKHSDLRIVDCLEGDGKYKGVLGSFVVEFKDNTVNVGSGFTDQQREQYWLQRDNLIGGICQVKYKETSYDKNTGLESLQFPVFETLRTDKNQVSYE